MNLNKYKHYFNIFKKHPDILAFLSLNYLKLLSGKKCLRGVEFAITYDCQLNCEHCLKSNIKKEILRRRDFFFRP